MQLGLLSGRHTPHSPHPSPSPGALRHPLLSKGTALPRCAWLAVPGPWEDVPAKWHPQRGTRRLYLHLHQRAAVTHAHTPRLPVHVFGGCGLVTHLMQNGLDPGIRNYPSENSWVSCFMLFLSFFFFFFSCHPPQIKKKEKRKTQQEAEPKLAMTGSQGSQSSLPSLRTF